MDSPFHIHIDRLKDGKTLHIEEDVGSIFLGIDEEELKFQDKVEVKGEAYLADDHFVLKLKANTKCSMPCTICNEMTKLSLVVENFYFSLPLVELSGPIFDFAEPLREALLLELPLYLECQDGKCPERENIKVYLKKKPTSDDTSSTHFPFSNLEKEEFEKDS